MMTEELMYFNQFLQGTLPMTAFFTTDVNFVNTRLAAHYGFPAVPATAGFMQVTNTTDTRVGFMSLGAFLSFTSFSYRTAPTLRGKWVLENLLCQHIALPPPGVPKLDGAAGAPTDPALQSQNVAVRLAAHRTMPNGVGCLQCHTLLDPIGLGLENFDAIGAYRTKYANGDTITASGMLPPGATFGGAAFGSVKDLATALSTGTPASLLTDCASQKMMTYALSRTLTAADDPYLAQVRQQWSGQGWQLKPLLKDIALNDTFKFRRGETP
jgi:hypothetical protein